jgi:ATP-binding protein involved in chromosome partitioning
LSPNPDEVRAAIGAVQEPDLLRALDELGMLRALDVGRRKLKVELALPAAQWPARQELSRRLAEVLERLDGVRDVEVEMVVMTDQERVDLRRRLASPPGGEPAAASAVGAHGHSNAHGGQGRGSPPAPLEAREGNPNRYLLPGSRTRVIGVSSGKGGVGKSSVTVNLAVALAAKGSEVGILDADVYGFSVPKMMGIDRDPAAIDDLLVPPVVHGVRCLSMGFFVPDDQPVIWRGPMLHKTLEQFLVEAYWGEPDFLLVDMPPGTGDVALSLGQYLPRAEIVVVTTPQPAAQRVAQRSAYAAKQLKLSVRGVIENMSWFTGDDAKRYELFGSGGGAMLAESLEVPLLGQVPFVPSVREGSDTGRPVRAEDPGGEAALAFDALADALIGLGPARIYRSELRVR